jgi:hypothetical protein
VGSRVDSLIDGQAWINQKRNCVARLVQINLIDFARLGLDVVTMARLSLEAAQLLFYKANLGER